MNIKYLNCSWSTKSSHSRAALFTFIFICSKEISSLVFVGSGVASCCFDEYVHPFNSSFTISTQIIILHLRITISSYSILLASLNCGMLESNLIWRCYLLIDLFGVSYSQIRICLEKAQMHPPLFCFWPFFFVQFSISVALWFLNWF